MNNELPHIPTGKEIEEREKYGFDLSGNWLDMSVDYPAPRFLLQYNGVGFSPLGGIQAISGQKKNGKTFVLCQLMAAVLNSDSERMRAHLPGLKLNDDTNSKLAHDPVVLYCDTEQEIENTARVARRVHYLCGWPMNEANPRFRVLWLRAEESIEDRWGKIKQAIHEVRPTAIFLDGIRDVIADFNDPGQSAALITECMSIATKGDCCMWCVLHENPGSDKMRGHLGTELGNKVTDTFVSTKKKTAEGVTFTVKQQDARSKDVDDWTFEITDDAGGLGIPRIKDAVVITDVKAERFGNVLTEDEKKELSAVLRTLVNPPSSKKYTVLRDGLKKHLKVGTDKATYLMHVALELNILNNPVNGKYSYNQSKGDELEGQTTCPF
jgi:hypothetical protein